MASDAAVLVTGATGGLGRQTALALARRGRDVVLGGRRADAVDSLCREIESSTDATARPFVADLADLESVRQALAQLPDAPLHGIVTNAGMQTRLDARSADGFELTFAVNVLAHQVILCALAGQVVGGGRVVVVSSGVHEPDHMLARRAGIPAPRWVGTRKLAVPDDAEPSERLADWRQRYSTSKLGNVLQARGLQARLRQQGRDIDVFAIDPGLMIDTRLAREIPAAARVVLRAIGRLVMPFVDNMRLSPVAAGHITSLVEDPQWHGEGFAYLDGDHVKPPSDDALDDALVDGFWRESAALIRLTPEQTVLPLQ
jgi:protochlorophyllide reductase